MDVKKIEIREVGPREGYQFEGIGNPDKISTANKIRLVDALSHTGLKLIQVTSFVNPKQVPQMADADEVSAGITISPGVDYEALYMNERGLERALAAGVYKVDGKISLTASETFCKMNQNRDSAQDIVVARNLLELYKRHGVKVAYGSIMAAFGCNYEGEIPTSHVLDLVQTILDLADDAGEPVNEIWLADTMGQADPELVKRTIGAIRDRWPDLVLALHLHDTRGTGMANFYAALEVGVAKFDTSVGGLGGCPFAKVAAGNIPTEDVVFMAQRMGIETGLDLEALVECAKLAEEIVGHPLPSRMAHATA